ncbi:MAG: P-II family nitrogen regulator [Cyclobacteriaceae bacterium]
MKSVMCIIRINKMNKTKRALSKAGISSMTAAGNAFGRGQGLWDAKVMKAAQEDVPEAIELLGKEPPLRPHRVLTVTVPDELVSKVVETVIAANQVSEHGDGKIFVMPEYEAIRIRTGEHGDEVLD